jgi:hypothetical protein
MGISRWTALVIQAVGNDIRCEVYGQPGKDGKWVGAVNQYHDDHLHTTLLTSEPVHDSAEQAVVEMEEIVADIKAREILA